jgi:hypothetical protein
MPGLLPAAPASRLSQSRRLRCSQTRDGRGAIEPRLICNIVNDRYLVS